MDTSTLSAKSQRILVWWALSFVTLFGLTLVLLLHMLPPPPANWTAEQIAQFYTDHSAEIKVGAVICCWTSGFLVPLAVVVGVQMRRHEKGARVWTILAVAGGTLMTVFAVLPPVFFGVAAFSPGRAPDVTAVIHELGVLSLVATDQYVIFLFVAVAVVCLISNTVVHSPFPRWFGYFTIWTALAIEVGAVAFLFRAGPFSWNGLFVFWLPFAVFGGWILVMSILLLRALARQESAASDWGSLEELVA
jgi:hypothetical protein